MIVCESGYLDIADLPFDIPNAHYRCVYETAIKITAKVITPKVTVSVFSVPALSGTYFFPANRPATVSYTHLDVYKRQE